MIYLGVSRKRRLQDDRGIIGHDKHEQDMREPRNLSGEPPTSCSVVTLNIDDD